MKTELELPSQDSTIPVDAPIGSADLADKIARDIMAAGDGPKTL